MKPKDETVMQSLGGSTSASDKPCAPAWTPGPWVIQEYPGERFAEVWSENPLHERAIAKVWHGGWLDEANNRRSVEMEASNAHLIAAAPELYDAAAKALDYMRLHKYADQAWADDLERALAKARGEA